MACRWLWILLLAAGSVQAQSALVGKKLISRGDSIERVRQQKGARAASVKHDDREMLFEPDPATVFEALLPLFLNREIYQCVLDSKASEHSARMVAMKAASDNATKAIGSLQLVYNKARQAAITQEISEIVGGAAAV